MADRLRRGNSTASGGTASSVHATPDSLDPFVTRQAEVAAAKAYLRSRQSGDMSLLARRPVPSKLRRRKSQASGRTEGSHFEDARLGLRRAASTKEDKPTAKTVVRHHLPPGIGADTGDELPSIVTRKRAVIPPSAHQQFCHHDQLPSSTANRIRRKSHTGYADGSPAARNGPGLSEERSALMLHGSSPSNTSDGYGSTLTPLPILPRSSEAMDVVVIPAVSYSLNTARDRYLQDFQQRKVRERKSFITAPFQKRKTYADSNRSSDGLGSSLPFHHVTGKNQVPLQPLAISDATAPLPKVDRRPRMFSGTLKGQLSRLFRRASKSPGELPLQQVAASHSHHFESGSTCDSFERAARDTDPFMAPPSHDILVPSSKPVHGSSSGRHSAAPPSTVKSRVTSWTNSTLARTWSTRGGEDEPAVGEQGELIRRDDTTELQRSDSMATLRTASSFFGRPSRNKLRRASKVDMRSTDESQGLYDALRERMQPSALIEGPTNQDVVIDQWSLPKGKPSGLLTLPSQRRSSSRHCDAGGSTIRNVTPDLMAYRLGVPETITEITSPAMTALGSVAAPPEGSSLIYLRREAAIRAQPPSVEDIARRVKKIENRWQAPLDVTQISRWSTEDNPYELPSQAAPRQQVNAKAFTRHAIPAGQDAWPENEQGMLSPSVYSRATDDASPRPRSPLDNVGTVFTITGREVRRYSLSPSKLEETERQTRPPSKDWKRWLSDEFSGFRQQPEDYSLNDTCSRTHVPDEIPPEGRDVQRSLLHPLDDPEFNSRPSSAAQQPLGNPSRPRIEGRRGSSFMNDRYPLLDGSRHSSTHSGVGSEACRVSSSVSRERQPDSRLTSAKLTSNVLASSKDRIRSCVLTERRSLAFLENTERRHSGLTANEHLASESRPTLSSSSHASKVAAIHSDEPSGRTSRAKSAFDLRARYRSNQQSTARPLDVRRKTTLNESPHANESSPHHLDPGLEDATLRHIAAGPYSSSSCRPLDGKENSFPTLPSSEWLAGPGPGPATAAILKARSPPTAVHPAFRDKPTPARSSPASSAAQRMATEYLQKKTWGGVAGSPPAFM